MTLLALNIGFIEFWVMDPFINNSNGTIDDGKNDPKPNTSGGKLIFHLGSISEDLMRDGKHAFENGLPTDGNLVGGAVTENNWGYVTSQQYLNNAFNNIFLCSGPVYPAYRRQTAEGMAGRLKTTREYL